MKSFSSDPWRVSLHGGHSSAYCDHAVDPLEALVEAAIGAGYHTFGITEHAPRLDPALLYPEERALGWDVPTLERHFDAYARESAALVTRYRDRIVLLRGFEAEVVPTGRYARVMRDYRERHAFDYIVGSVHHVRGALIDYDPASCEQITRRCGGREGLAVEYYGLVAEMADALRPEVVGHLDLVRKYAPDDASVATPVIRAAAARALDAIARNGCILDINTAGYRKGFGRPYVAPWLVEAALERGIGLCFGDDSHGVTQVGAGITEAREYLLALGVQHITTLARDGGALVSRSIPIA